MNLYEANYVKSYEVQSVWGQDMRKGTAIERLAFLIDAEWKHSWHWPKSVDNELLDRIKDSLDREMARANQRVSELEQARKILISIERETESDPND